MSIPYLQFYYESPDLKETNIKLVVWIQIILNAIYIMDFITVLFVNGLQDVLFNSYGFIYLEFVLIPYFFVVLREIEKILELSLTMIKIDHELSSQKSLFIFFFLSALFRLIRLQKLMWVHDQWASFVKAIMIGKRPFFELLTLLYSLFHLFCLIGVEIYGGKVNQKLFI